MKNLKKNYLVKDKYGDVNLLDDDNSSSDETEDEEAKVILRIFTKLFLMFESLLGIN